MSYASQLYMILTHISNQPTHHTHVLQRVVHATCNGNEMSVLNPVKLATFSHHRKRDLDPVYTHDCDRKATATIFNTLGFAIGMR